MELITEEVNQVQEAHRGVNPSISRYDGNNIKVWDSNMEVILKTLMRFKRHLAA